MLSMDDQVGNVRFFLFWPLLLGPNIAFVAMLCCCFLYLYIRYVDLEVGNSSGTNSSQLDDGSGAVKGYRGRSLWLERFGTSLKRAAKFLSYFAFEFIVFCTFMLSLIVLDFDLSFFFCNFVFSSVENVCHQPKESNRIFAAVVSSNAVECQFSLQLFFNSRNDPEIA